LLLFISLWPALEKNTKLNWLRQRKKTFFLFSKAVPSTERDELLKVEKYFRQKYDMRTLTNKTIARLTSAADFQTIKGKIEDEPSYRVD
jgi:hypothetical protein